MAKVHIPLVYDLVGMKKNKINEFNYNKLSIQFFDNSIIRLYSIIYKK